MATRDQSLELRDLRGGRNSSESPLGIGPSQVVEAENVEYYRAAIARRRQGSQTITTGTFPNSSLPFFLFRHVPGDESTAELWGFDLSGSVPLSRVVAGSAWSTVGNIPDSIVTVTNVSAASFAGKLFFAHHSLADRLHCWDPAIGLRRVGISAAAVPTIGNTGAGSYPAKPRFYRIQWYANTTSGQMSSEWSAAVSFTPSGTGAAARITAPATPSAPESVGAWRLFGSRDGVGWYYLNAVVAGTTFIDDAIDPDQYSAVAASASTLAFSQTAGDHAVPTGVRHLLVDDNRLILAGSYTSTALDSTIWWTPVLGTVTGCADDERIPIRNRLDLNMGNGGGITGLARLDGSVVVFKYGQVHQLQRTGIVTQAYTPRIVTDSAGAISGRAIVSAFDERDTPCLYFLSRQGPYRYGLGGGVQFLGDDIADIWKRVNLEFPPATAYPPFGLYHHEKKQVWFVVSLDGVSLPNFILKFNLNGNISVEGSSVRGGWTIHPLTQGVSSGVMFSRTLGATMSRDLKPVLQPYVSGAKPVQHDADDVGSDDGVGYRGYVRTRPYLIRSLGQYESITDAYVLAQRQTNPSAFRLTAISDFGVETKPCDVAVPALSGGITHDVVQVEDASLGQCQALQLEIGDADDTATEPWAIDAITFKLAAEDER